LSRIVRREGERKSLWGRIKEVALTDVTVLVRGLDRGSLEGVEELLLTSDFGVPATLRLVDRIEALSRQNRIRTEEDFRGALQKEIALIVSAGEETDLAWAEDGLTVYLLVGVNGVGKTTSAGKLAHLLKRRGRRVMLAAADTFRAGAVEQLRLWAQKVDTEFVGAQQGADPASVAFDAIEAARARDVDVLIIDTAGRLQTQDDLMTELTKVERVIAKKVPHAPHETLLVLDATVGQNALSQVRIFTESMKITGLILAKLDSSAKGGVVVSLKQEFGLAVKLIGTGEVPGAMEPFEPERFARQVLIGSP
jgi:fused signal recognition particle receptor